MMLRSLSLLLAVLASAFNAAGQTMPVDCACSDPMYDNWPQSHALIGNADSNAYCYTDSSGEACRAVGTITFTFQPPCPFTITQAYWGTPYTDITTFLNSLSCGVQHDLQFVHPANGWVYCEAPNPEVGSVLYVAGYFGSSNTYAFLVGYRTWHCETIQ
jgi:hypothetical protein